MNNEILGEKMLFEFNYVCYMLHEPCIELYRPNNLRLDTCMSNGIICILNMHCPMSRRSRVLYFQFKGFYKK